MGYMNVHFEVPFTMKAHTVELDTDKSFPICFRVETMVGTNHNDSLLFNSMVGLIRQGKLEAAYDIAKEFATFEMMRKFGISRWPLSEEDIENLSNDPELTVTVTPEEDDRNDDNDTSYKG
jgi:hypothetical protein